MDDFDDFDRLRLGWTDPIPRDREAGGPAAFVGRVTTTSPAVGKFLMVRPVRLLGGTAAQPAGSFTEIGTEPVPVYLVGPGVPAADEYLVVRRVRDRWAAERRSTDSPTGPCCSDSGGIPEVLTLDFHDSTPPSGLAEPLYGLKSSTLTWGAIPAEAPLGTTGWFSPNLATGAGGKYYYATCLRGADGSSGTIGLSFVYVIPHPGPPPFSVWTTQGGGGLYGLYSWPFPFGEGNSCSPFLMTNGTYGVDIIDILDLFYTQNDLPIPPGLGFTLSG